MKHKRIAANSHVVHEVVSIPAKGIEPTMTYKARVQRVYPVGPKVVFEWAIFAGTPKKKEESNGK